MNPLTDELSLSLSLHLILCLSIFNCEPQMTGLVCFCLVSELPEDWLRGHKTLCSGIINSYFSSIFMSALAVEYSTISEGKSIFSSTGYGLVWLGLVWFDLVWFGMVFWPPSQTLLLPRSGRSVGLGEVESNAKLSPHGWNWSLELGLGLSLAIWTICWWPRKYRVYWLYLFPSLQDTEVGRDSCV